MSAEFQRPHITAQHWPQITGGAVALFVGLVLLALFSRALSLNFVLVGVGGLLLVLFVWININLRGVRVRRRFDDHAFMGQTVSVTVDLQNRGLMPVLWLQAHERLPLELRIPSFYRTVLSLAPFERTHLAYELTCRRRGYYSVGELELRTGDFWGVFEQTGVVAGQPLIVYPRTIAFTRLPLPARAPFGAIARPPHLQSDPSRFYGVRPYSAGDSQRSIHWTATARTGTLQVRRFQSSIALPAHILLDLNQAHYPVSYLFSATEMGITVAASLAVYLHRTRQPVGLTALGLDPLSHPGQHHIPARSGQGHLMQVLELLARIDRAPLPNSLADAIQHASLGLPWGTLLFIVTPTVDDTIEPVLVGLHQRGLQPVLLLTAPNATFQRQQARLARLGTPLLRAETDADFDRWRV